MKIEMRHQWEVTQNTTKVKKKLLGRPKLLLKWTSDVVLIHSLILLTNL